MSMNINKKWNDLKNQYQNYSANQFCQNIINLSSIHLNAIGIRVFSNCYVNLYSGVVLLCIIIDTSICLYFIIL